MSILFPRVAFAPVRCGPVFRTEVAPIWSLFDETLSQLQQASRQSSRKPFNPRFNVKEDKDTYLVEGELPGFDSKDISIEFLDEGHTLQIKGRTQSVKESGKPSEAEQATATADTASETNTVKSHQATVEDEVEQPANASAATEEASTAAESSSQAVANAQPEQQVQQTKAPEVKHWVTERYTGAFSRQFKFPAKVNQEAVKASLKDGILSIALPFAPKPESRRINIE